MPFPLTEEQRKIVDDRGGELLVSAAAGSGKTRVLVERLIFLEQDEIEKNKGIRIEKYLSVLTE
jgi:ATP-dependent helicase/nuclease subunit A